MSDVPHVVADYDRLPGAAVTIDDNAPAIDRLAAFLGGRP